MSYEQAADMAVHHEMLCIDLELCMHAAQDLRLLHATILGRTPAFSGACRQLKQHLTS